MKSEVEKEHATELRERVEVRVNESYCVEPGCEYNGQRAVQGHCYSRLNDETDHYIAALERRAQESLQFYRDHPGDDYVKTLESMYLCATMNWDSTLDALVRLRCENAALKAHHADFTSCPGASRAAIRGRGDGQ